MIIFYWFRRSCENSEKIMKGFVMDRLGNVLHVKTDLQSLSFQISRCCAVVNQEETYHTLGVTRITNYIKDILGDNGYMCKSPFSFVRNLLKGAFVLTSAVLGFIHTSSYSKVTIIH